MNYAVMRHVAEGCRVEGPGRAILWALAYRADRHTGEAWVSMTRLAAESGVSLATIKRQLHALIDGGHVGIVLHGAGRRPTSYRVLTEPASGVTRNPQGNGLVVSERAGSERHHKIVAVSSESRSGLIGGSVVGSQRASPIRKEGKNVEGFEGSNENRAAAPSPSPSGDASAAQPPTRCRHRNDPDTCGACSDPTPAMPPRDQLAAVLGRPRSAPDPETMP